MPNLRVPQNFTGGYVAADLITHLGKATTTLCACFIATSAIDASVVAMTSYSSDLTGVPGYPGVTFKRNTGVSASQLQSDAGNAFSQMEASMFLLAAGITEADVLAGKWAHATAVLFITNYEALNMGQLIMQSGYQAEFTQKGLVVTAEIKGLNNALTAQIGNVTRPECLHDFCDTGCGLTASDYTSPVTLTSVTSQTVFADSALTTLPADYFNNGKIVFTDGNNVSYVLRIDSFDHATGTFTLRTPAPYIPLVGARANALAGCQKRLVDCQTRVQVDTTVVNNILNRKAIDYSPTLESFSRLPATLAT